ncbi:hypothetical protein [Streptomyces sp. NBC_00344]|uniref:hypothetical protein n=1 Tax=Streptomyces sp. NBC_00344 TaxID=2975720 RepID=UPI002E1DBBA9
MCRPTARTTVTGERPDLADRLIEIGTALLMTDGTGAAAQSPKLRRHDGEPNVDAASSNQPRGTERRCQQHGM